MWNKFTAYNTQTRYGWTDDPAVADAALEAINRNREINVYAMTELSESDDETDGREGAPLRDHQGLLFDADTRVEDLDPENW